MLTSLDADLAQKNTTSLLFVDDEENILEAIKRILQRRAPDWENHYALSVDEAVGVLENQKVDTVVTDLSMPGKDGFELLQHIRNTEETYDLPVVILTGLNEKGLKKKALEMGATDLLNKPVDPDELVARLASVVRIKTYQDEIKKQNQLLDQKVKERTAELENARVDLIWRLGKAGEYRDEETGNHVIRVGHYCRTLAEGLGLDHDFIERIFLTSPMHDVGKIGIPDSILLKPGALSAPEWEIMQGHTLIGHDILHPRGTFQHYTPHPFYEEIYKMKRDMGNPFLVMASTIALGHHEWWNGEGYPHGLSEDDIPLECRIVCHADVFDALLSERPYKKPFTEEETLNLMRNLQGRQFDPDVFDVFEKSLDTFRDIREHFKDEDENVE